MTSFQKKITLNPRNRGFHLITSEILEHCEEISEIDIGILHVFITHTSASIGINENADPTVRTDFESHMNKLVPEDAPYYIHTYEGPDDMPAHIKASFTGASISIPISDHNLMLGTWQGIYLCEFRNQGGARKLIASIYQ